MNYVLVNLDFLIFCSLLFLSAPREVILLYNNKKNWSPSYSFKSILIMYTGAEIIAISTWNILPRLFQKNSSRPLINIKIPQSTSHTVKIKFKHNSDLSSSIFFFSVAHLFSLYIDFHFTRDNDTNKWRVQWNGISINFPSIIHGKGAI